MAKERRRLAKNRDLIAPTFDLFIDMIESAIGHPPTLDFHIAVPVVLMSESDLAGDTEARIDRIAWWTRREGWLCGWPLDSGTRCSELYVSDQLLTDHRVDKHGV